jgi:hypothetical protein
MSSDDMNRAFPEISPIFLKGYAGRWGRELETTAG